MTRWFVHKIPAGLVVQGITIRLDMREPEEGAVLNGRTHEKTCRLMEVIRPLPTTGGHAVDVELGYQVADGSVTIVRPFRDDREMMCRHDSEIQLFDDFDQLVDFFSEIAASYSYQS